MSELIVRASEVKNLMVLPRLKKELLSETTKTWLKTKAKEQFYGYKSFKGNKYTQKGIMCENEATELLSEYLYLNPTKLTQNKERVTHKGFSGECDVIDDDLIIDTKCPWSIDTFPAFTEDADKEMKKAGYDWQQKVYLRLFQKERAQIAYVLVNTPDELLTDWDDRELHNFNNLTVGQSITLSSEIVLTDKDIELMDSQYALANKYYKQLMEELQNK